ncbi:MAG: DUF368 domain-containing protein [Actinomycetes bacterium]
MTSPSTAARTDARKRAAPLHAVRGALIGAAEVVPGVSGGTVALVVGLYGTLIGSAGQLLTVLRLLVTGRRREAREAHSHVPWVVLVPVGLGMVTALVVGARVLEPLLEEHPVGARAVFAGMILASLVVPYRLVGRWGAREAVLAVLAALLAALLTGLPPGAVADPPLPVVTVAAAVAVCALVLPGVSGSFLLLTVGLYAPTLGAVNDRDWAYLGASALGALLGLGAFVTLLQHLLTHHPKVTLAVMTGLMAGSLRALWPWQTAGRDVLAPGGDAWPVLGLVVAGAAVVVVTLLLEHRIAASRREL